MKKMWLAGALALLMTTSAVSAKSASNTRADDYFQVLEISSRYAWGVDTLDKELLSTVFAADAHAHFRIVNDNPIKLDEKLNGFEAIFAFLQRSLGRRKGFELLPWHFMSNQIVEIHGDNASLRFFMHNRPGTAGGVYYMQLARTPQGWRVKDVRLDEQQLWNISGYTIDEEARAADNKKKD